MSRTTPAPRWGTANLNRCARSPYPRGTPESGLPRLDAEPGKIPQNPRRPDKSLTEPAEKYREILAKCGPGGSPEPPESVRERARAKEMRKINFCRLQQTSYFFQGTVLAPFWAPAGSPKSTKNEPGTEKVRPETAPEVIFVDSSCRCRSESLSEPIFGGSDP